MGSNRLPLALNYGERVKYRQGDYFFGLPTPIDTFYDKVFYGKVDRFQNVIIPKKQSDLIKQVSDDSNVFCFDFVADAFFDLKRNLKIAGDSGGIERINTKLYDINAVNGWQNYDSPYQAILRNAFAAYRDYLKTLSKKEFNKIRTAQDYATGLLDYLKTGNYGIPLTLTEFVLSANTPYTITGIVLETSPQSYSSDLPKFTQYFMDINFAYYVRAARKFGFYVDKNGPWRLFADVLSDPMLERYAQRGVQTATFFDSYYDRTYTLDLEYFKQELLTAYNEFAVEHRRITESSPATVACPVSQIRILGVREQATAAELNEWGNSYWLGYYFHLRSLESGVKYMNGPSLIKEAVVAARAYGYEHGLIYINNLFKPYLYDIRLFNEKFLTGAPDTVRVGSVSDGPTNTVGVGISPY